MDTTTANCERVAAELVDYESQWARDAAALLLALAAERDALRGLLQEYQWSQGGTCPCCGAWGSGSRQHSPTCYIGIALKEPT